LKPDLDMPLLSTPRFSDLDMREAPSLLMRDSLLCATPVAQGTENG